MDGRSLFQIVSVLFLVLALAFAWRQRLWVESADATYGTVTSIRDDPGCAMTRTATIEVAGSGHRFEVTYGSKGPRYVVNEPVDVLVDPTDSSVVMLESRKWSNATMFVAVSGVTALYALFGPRRR